MRQLALLGLLTLMCMAAGCATLRGDTQKVTFDTDPTGAALNVDGQKYTTPAEVALKRKEAHRIAIEKPGYCPIAFNLESTWDGASLTDFAVPGGSALLGLSVATGSDRQFNTLTRIKLEKTTDPRPATIEMYQYHGRILSKAEYDQAIADEQKNTSRFMGGND
jgi:hypothetical protein